MRLIDAFLSQGPLLVGLEILVVILFLSGLRIAREYERGVVLRFGRYAGTRGPGLYWIIPLVETVITVDLRIDTTNVSGQEAISRDNVPIRIDAVIWRRVVAAERSVFQVSRVGEAVTDVASTSLREVIGRHTLDDVLKEQAAIAEALKAAIDAVTHPWGVEVVRVAMRSVEIPATMQRAMAQEAEALREKRARVIKAEAEVEAARKLAEAAATIAGAPAALELRRMQMLTEIGAEQNTMTVVMMPSEFVDAARAFAGRAAPSSAPAPAAPASPAA